MRIKPVLQITNTECGLCCIAMISQYYGYIKPMSFFRQQTDIGRDGMSVQLICDSLKSIHLKTKLLNMQDALLNNQLPGIVHLERNHFAVIEKYDSSQKKAVIIDPSIGKVVVNEDDLFNTADGFLIFASPDKEFQKAKEKDRPWEQLSFLFKVIKSSFCVSILLSIATYFFSLAIPRVIQIVIDQIGVNNGLILEPNKWIFPISSAVLFLLISFGRNYVLVKMEMIIDKNLLFKFMNHILSLPYKYFEIRSSGDLLFRINLLNSIRLLISEGLIRGIIDFGSILFILTYMAFLSRKLTLMIAIALVFICLIASTLNSRIIALNKKELQDLAKVTNVETEIIEMIYDIKALRTESLFINNLEEKYKAFQKQFKKRELLSRENVSILQFFQLFLPFFTLLISVNVMNGTNITIGEIIAFYTLSNMAISTATATVQEATNFRLMKNYMLRINDVLQEKAIFSSAEQDIEELNALTIQNVSFKYSVNSEYVLKDINLNVVMGKKVAIVGESGAGKSTLIKLILGLYQPEEGSVKLNQYDVKDISSAQFKKLIGVIPQDIKLFNGSIRYNITLGEDIPDDIIEDALKKAKIYEDIEQMPLKENTLVTMGGKNFSSGQRQRIALARVLAFKPQMVILDEATNSLDGINESEIMAILDDMNITQIIVSHRFSTIKNADYAYLIKGGTIKEQGTISELINQKNLFFELFREQITMLQ